MKTIALALALALPAASLAAEGPKRATRPDLRADVPEYQLDTQVFYCPSGLTVMFQEDHSHPIVSIMSIVDHGSGDDPKGKEGLAHFVEHTWFRSTQTVSLKWDENGNPIPEKLPSIMDLLQDYGTLFNATTRNDWTDYRTVFASHHLDLFLQLESKRLTSPYVGVTEEGIKTETEVITNEWRRRNDQGSSRLFDYLYAAVYPENHPYHSSSTKETLANIELKDLQKYMDDYYHPENTTIMVVGDFDIREATSMLLKNFDLEVIDPKLKPEHLFTYARPGVANPDTSNPDHWLIGAYDPNTFDPATPAAERDLYHGFLKPEVTNPETGAVERNDQDAIDARVRIGPKTPRDDVPSPGAKGLVTPEAPIDYRTVIAAWSLPGAYREDHAHLQMVGNLANFAVRSYFNPNNFRMFREEWKDSDIGGGDCGVQLEKVHSTLMCFVEVRNPKLDSEQIAEKIIDQMPTIWNPDLVMALEQQNFPRARQESLSGILKSVDNVAYHFGGRAEDIVTYAHYTGQPRYHSAAMNQAMTLNALEVAGIASKYLTRDRAVTVVVEPLPPSKIDRTGEGSKYAGSSDTDTLLESGEWVKNITDEEIANAYVKPDISKVVDTKLENGLRVLILPHGDAPVAFTSLVFHGGTLTGEKDRLDFMNTFSISEGIDKWDNGFPEGADPLEIAGEYFGGFGSEHSYMALRHAAGNVDGAMWMLREEIEGLRPSLAGKAELVKAYRKSFGQAWTSSSPNWLIAQYRDRHNFPNTPIRWNTSWEELDTYATWGVDDVTQMLADVYQPKNATLIVTGRIEDTDEVLENAKKYFGGWTPRAGAASDLSKLTTVPTSEMADGAKILIFDGPKRTQTQINGSCRLNYSGTEDEPAVDVLSSIIGNEVFTRLRVKEALAYSPGGFAYVDVGNVAMLGFSSLSVNDGAARTVEVMRELVKSAAEGKFDGDTVTIHKLRESRNRGLEAQSTSQIGARLRGLAVDDLPAEELTLYGERIAKVDGQAIKELVQGCRNRLLFTMHGPADVLTKQLDEKGYEYEVIDWKAEGEARFSKYDPKGFKKYSKKKAKDAAKKAEAEGSADAQ